MDNSPLMQEVVGFAIGALTLAVYSQIEREYHVVGVAKISSRIDKILSRANKRHHKMTMVKRCCAGGVE